MTDISAAPIVAVVPPPPPGNALQDAQGNTSSRRVGAFIALGSITFCTALFALLSMIMLAYGKAVPTELWALLTTLVNVNAAVATGGLLLATADRFAPSK